MEDAGKYIIVSHADSSWGGVVGYRAVGSSTVVIIFGNSMPFAVVY